MTCPNADFDRNTTKIPVELRDGSVIWVEVAETGKQDVAFDSLPFSSVTHSIRTIAESIGDTIAKVGPTKATIKYGIEIGVEQGSLVAALVRGKGKANLEITLEWENPNPKPPIQVSGER